jgi:predicted O-methyltransferase YrrM
MLNLRDSGPFFRRAALARTADRIAGMALPSNCVEEGAGASPANQDQSAAVVTDRTPANVVPSLSEIDRAQSGVQSEPARDVNDLVSIPYPVVDLATLRDPLAAILAAPELNETNAFFSHCASAQRSLVSAISQALIYALIRNLRPDHVFEIGTYMAGTAEAICRALHANGQGILHTTDPYGGDRVPPIIAQWPPELRRHIRFYCLDSMSFFTMLIGKTDIRPDLVFIDGNHDYEFAGFDIGCAARLLRPAGFILVDNVSQAGPFWAVRDFLTVHSDWTECRVTERPYDPNRAFDAQRSNIPNTDFIVLRAPPIRTVAARPVSFNELLLQSPRFDGVVVPLGDPVSEGELHVQCVLRGFSSQKDDVEEVSSTSLSLSARDTGARLSLPICMDIGPGFDTIRLEIWLMWTGDRPLPVAGAPSVVGPNGNEAAVPGNFQPAQTGTSLDPANNSSEDETRGYSNRSGEGRIKLGKTPSQIADGKSLSDGSLLAVEGKAALLAIDGVSRPKPPKGTVNDLIEAVIGQSRRAEHKLKRITKPIRMRLSRREQVAQTAVRNVMSDIPLLRAERTYNTYHPDYDSSLVRNFPGRVYNRHSPCTNVSFHAITRLGGGRNVPDRVWKPMLSAALAEASSVPHAHQVFERRSFVERYVSELANKYGSHYVPGWVNLDDALFLYWLVRQAKPRTIVQTGVCNGLSAAFMMLALVKNGPEGRLRVIDLPPVFDPADPVWTVRGTVYGVVIPEGKSSGWLVPDVYRDRFEVWNGDAKDLLPPLVDRVESIDFFYHDSDHTYDHMMFEFHQVKRKLNPGGLVVSDDISWNASLWDFADQFQVPAYNFRGTIGVAFF